MYTLILMSSRGDSVRQQAISQGHVLFFSILISALFLAGLGGLGYGFFQKQQRAVSEKSLQTSMEKVEELVRAKLQIESELTIVNQEMQSIRQMAQQIQQTLGLFGQGGGDVNATWTPEETEGQANPQQEDPAVIPDTAPYAPEKEKSLTPSTLQQEILPLYAYVSEHQTQINGYPSILPVDLQKSDGEKYVFWYSSRFGWRTHPLTRKREFHHGLDIKTRAGVPVIAAADGTILKAEKSGYLGKTIEISHDGLIFKTMYAHLKDYVDGLEIGQRVTRGQVIGYVGNTGRSTGAHLHYGVYDTRIEKWVNPISYIFDQQPTISP